MTSRDFCFWLQGYLEVQSAGGAKPDLTVDQVECVQRHLALAFKHEIDPSMGPPAHQTELDKVHAPVHTPPGVTGPKIGGAPPSGHLLRC